MVNVSILPRAEFGRNDDPEEALHFRILDTIFMFNFETIPRKIV